MKLSDEEQSSLQENIDSALLLKAVDDVDKIRQFFGNRDVCQPPQIRDDLLKLHDLAMAVVHYDQFEKAGNLFNLALGLEMELMEVTESLEKVRAIIIHIVEQCPENAFDG